MVGRERRIEAELEEVEGNGSRAERQIARILNRYGIGYEYEHPVAVVDRGHIRVWYPDFWLPDYGTLIEYVGGLKDRDYTEGIEHKKVVYEARVVYQRRDPDAYLERTKADPRGTARKILEAR